MNKDEIFGLIEQYTTIAYSHIRRFSIFAFNVMAVVFDYLKEDFRALFTKECWTEGSKTQALAHFFG